MPFISSKETARKPGSLTTGDTDKVLLVGPSAPATKRGLAGARTVAASAQARVSLAAATLIPRAMPGMPESLKLMAVELKGLAATISSPPSMQALQVSPTTSGRV